MSGNLTFEELKAAAASGEIDTVLTCIVDMQGRLMGKRFHVSNFLESSYAETHGCNYLLATDIEMTTVQGYKATSWAAGYGDYAHRPDLSTLRRVPWLPGTAMVMCDVQDHHDPVDIPHAPRAVLKAQIARARALGFEPLMATELEFYLFDRTFDELNADGYRAMQTVGRHNNDYSIFGTTKEEDVMRALRNGLHGAGIPVENSKGEAEAGQEEINIRYSDALDTADNHAIVKNAVKEIAFQHGRAATFMAKYATDRAGSSSHVHVSLWTDGQPAFLDKAKEHGMSDTFRAFLAGLLAHAEATTLFFAPYANSYKRFTVGMFAPTKAVWSIDNRTAGFRVCSENSKGIRVESRIGGADLNPYLACAALLAAGLDGIENSMALEPEMRGDMYHAQGAREVPKTLRAAIAAAEGSDMLRAAFGEDVLEHYLHAARWEQSETDRVVTDWDRLRGFERA